MKHFDNNLMLAMLFILVGNTLISESVLDIKHTTTMCYMSNVTY